MSSLRIENFPWQEPDAPKGVPGERGQTPTAGPTTQGQDTSTADPGTGAGAGKSATDPCLSNLPLLAVFAIAVWFLIIRPQQKQEKKRRSMLEALQKGDKVVTSGGVHATVHEIQENTIIINTGEVKLTVDRSAITRVAGGEAAEKK